MKRATGPPMWPLAPKLSTLPADIVITLSPGLPQPGVLAREPHLDAQRAITSALRVREGTVPSITSLTFRPDERRVGKACVSTVRSRWSPYTYKNRTSNKHKRYANTNKH